MSSPTTLINKDTQKIAHDKVAHNENNIYLCRIFVSIMFGVMTGVFGFTGLSGFLIFALSSLFASFLIILSLPRFSIQGVFQSWSSVWLGGFMQGALTFILCWTLAYDSVYIFQ